DDVRGAVRGRPVDARLGRGRGAAPSARLRDLRRPDREPGVDALHHAGHLSRVRSPGAALAGRQAPGGAIGSARRRFAMNLSEPFVRRPVATVLLTIGIALAGIAALFVLPVAPLPQVEFPTISVSARLPGASP